MLVDRFPHETFLAQQAAALLGAGVDVHVLCQIEDPASDAWSLLDGVDMTGRIHPWPDRGRPIAQARAGAAAAIGALRVDAGALRHAAVTERQAAMVERGRAAGRGPAVAGRTLFDARLVAIAPDVLHAQFGDLARRRCHVAGAVDAAFTTSFRGYDLSYAGLDQPGFYDDLWPVLDGAHTLGHDLQRLAIERGCPDEVPWTIIPPAVDPSFFSIDQVPGGGRAPGAGRVPGADDEVRIISVGRLHWKKGLLDGLAAVAALRDTGLAVRYRIVGAGPDEEPVRWAIRDLGLHGVATLVGPGDPAEVRRHLADSDIFLHPALTEGFANAVLEAQAMGLPVVSTDAEGLGENVAHDVTGFVVPRRRPDLLAERLTALACDAGLRADMGRRGRQRVLDHFAIDSQTDAYIDFFARSIDRHRNRRPGRPGAAS